MSRPTRDGRRVCSVKARLGAREIILTHPVDGQFRVLPALVSEVMYLPSLQSVPLAIYIYSFRCRHYTQRLDR
jgi:hypothetical protein